jgi:long-chain acyl-CoA synthetase
MTATTERPAPATVTGVPGRIRDRAARTPDRVALREKDFGIWQNITWQQYWDTVVTVAHGLLSLGVDVGDRVAIQSENRPEWLFTDVATIAVRATTMGLYPTNPTAEVKYLLENSGTKILLAEDQEQVDKALAVVDELPLLEHIIYVKPRGVRRRYDDHRLLYWEDFLEQGRRHRATAEGGVERRLAEATPDDIVALIYTSGTTGPPKGAMLSAANVDFAIKTLVEEGGFTDPPPTQDDITLSYLPLSHVAERIFTTWFNASAGLLVHFAESIETVPQNLKEVQPTIFFGVPRIWEKIHATVEIRVASATRLKRWNYRFWMNVAARIGEEMVAHGGRHTGKTRMLTAIGNVFLFRALKDRIGLRKCRYAASGAAPIAPEVLKWFMGIGVPMHEVYGMTENTAVATANRPGNIKLGTVGEPYPTVEIRIDEKTGEILTRHPGVFAGYWQNEEATRQTIDEDGWLHTGDVGEWVDGTHLKITDRLKDIIITAGGKNISPSEIENSLKTSPFIKEAIVIGDRRSYLVALIGIEMDTVGDWATRRRIPYTTYGDLSSKPEVLELVQDAINQTNAKFASVEGIKKFRMLPKELDHEDGELTATQKVKRSAMASMFDDLVEEMYGGRS